MIWNRFLLAVVLLAATAGGGGAARAQGTTPLALVQQFDAGGNATPLSGCLVYFYVAGTVATPQQVFADYGLSQPLPNPVQCDQSGRVPMHWIANGLIHVRLTDASGVVQIDTILQALGPSSGGGPGGPPGTVDPTSIASTGDIKYRLSSEILTGWVILNGTTIGNATSGATQRANADTQNLFVYLWQNCTDAHCPVPGGRSTGPGGALADFNGSKQITLPNMQARSPVGRDCMGASCAGILLSGNITSGGSDGVDKPGAGGGLANQKTTTTISQANLPAVNFAVDVAVNIPAGQGDHVHGSAIGGDYVLYGAAGFSLSSGGIGAGLAATTGDATLPQLTGNGTGSAASGGSGTAATSASFAIMPPFLLVTWYQKL
jgi:hypothetical protein